MRRRTLLALGPLLLAAPGCSALDRGASPQEALETARTRLGEARTVSIELTSTGLPEGRNGVVSAKGAGIVDEASPRFQGQVTGTIQGNAATVDIIAVADDAWMSIFSKDYSPVDLAGLGAPNPAAFFRPTTGVQRVLAETTDLVEGESRREGRQVVQTCSGRVASQTISDLFLLGEGAEPFDVVYGVDGESGRLLTADITGAFYEGTRSTYSLRLSGYGDPVEISAPG